MITFYRTAIAAPGKTQPALAWAHEVAAHAKSVTGVEVHVGVPVGGNPQTIGWSAAYENLASFETQWNKLNADSKYWELVVKGSQYFVAGSFNDAIWRTV